MLGLTLCTLYKAQCDNFLLGAQNPAYHESDCECLGNCSTKYKSIIHFPYCHANHQDRVIAKRANVKLSGDSEQCFLSLSFHYRRQLSSVSNNGEASMEETPLHKLPYKPETSGHRQTGQVRKETIEVSKSHDILMSHTFVTPYWRSSHSLPGMLWYGVDIVKVFI